MDKSRVFFMGEEGQSSSKKISTMLKGKEFGENLTDGIQVSYRKI